MKNSILLFALSSDLSVIWLIQTQKKKMQMRKEEFSPLLICMVTQERRTSSFTALTTHFIMRGTSRWESYLSFYPKKQTNSDSSHANSTSNAQKRKPLESYYGENSTLWTVSRLRQASMGISIRREPRMSSTPWCLRAWENILQTHSTNTFWS